jgi:hypothetical protein
MIIRKSNNCHFYSASLKLILMLCVLAFKLRENFLVIRYCIRIHCFCIFKAMTFAISSPNDLESVINPSNFIDWE